MARIAYLVLDIETVPDEGLVRAVKYPNEEFSEGESAVARFQQEIRDKTQGRSDFIPSTFQLPVSLAYAALDEKGQIVTLGSLDRPHFRPAQIAETFWRLWSKHKPSVVTFNGKGFDLPVLEMCAMRYGISVPEWFTHRGALSAQPRYRFNLDRHFDLMEFFGNFGAMQMTGGLHLCATLLGKPGKMDTKGSMVQDLWDQGETLRIDDYCLCDVMDTYFVFLRSRVMLGELSLDEERVLVDAAKAKMEEAVEDYPGLEEYLAKFNYWQHPGESAGFFGGTKLIDTADVL